MIVAAQTKETNLTLSMPAAKMNAKQNPPSSVFTIVKDCLVYPTVSNVNIV
jgi:hypothetical protein